MKAFSFGENWLRYSRLIDAPRIAKAERSLRQLLGVERLDGLSVLDVGSGSALFAIAAIRLGAARVVAIDRDPSSVAAGLQNVDRFLDASQRQCVEVRHGDVLQRPVTAERFDIVYAWGSLHHTGAMWTAIDNAAACCANGAYLVLAIYNKTAWSPIWLRIKKLYNRAPKVLRLAMVAVLSGARAVVRVAQFKRPFSVGRGMDIWYDAADWLGGLPYECATPEEISAFMAARGGSLIRSFVTTRSGCNEFVFRQQGAPVAR